MIWTLNSDQDWECTAVLEDHLDSVTSIRAFALESLEKTSYLFVSCSVDGTAKLWYKDGKGSTPKCIQTIKNEKSSPISAILAELPGSVDFTFCVKQMNGDTSFDLSGIYLATGNTDNKIHIYSWDCVSSEFIEVAALDGHEDWVTSLSSTKFTSPSSQISENSAIKHWETGNVILASGSEDRYCRLWRIARQKILNQTGAPQDLISAEKDILTNVLKTGDINQLTVNAHTFICGNWRYKIEVESILSGHDDWIHSVNWLSRYSDTNNLVLITSSADQSVLLWKPEADSGIWSSSVRLGEVGGSIYGFYNALISGDGGLIVATGYHGSLHIWKLLQTADYEEEWVQDSSPTGHFEPVTDVQWEPYGRYFLSHSLDKTARIFGNWKSDSIANGTWHEISRPQIHGYELTCVTFVNPFVYSSGADEKVARVFEAPNYFNQIYNGLCVSPDLSDEKKSFYYLKSETLLNKEQPLEAMLPPLGLSNKAIFRDEVRSEIDKGGFQEELGVRRKTYIEAYVSTDIKDSSVVPSSLIHPSGHPPLEETLRRRTLWPEIEKIYGHPYEIFAIASSSINSENTTSPSDLNSFRSEERWISLSCKAKSAKNAGIRLYNSLNWRPAQSRDSTGDQSIIRDAPPLFSHSLTVTKMAFRPHSGNKPGEENSSLLLSVGRDRTISLFRITKPSDSTNSQIDLFQAFEKAHQRIIWDCAWSPSGSFFVTVSRDKTMKIWTICKNTLEYQLSHTEKLEDSATTVSITTKPGSHDIYWVSVGLESGAIVIYELSLPQDENNKQGITISIFASLHQKIAHSRKVNRLNWRPVSLYSVEIDVHCQRQLLSCSDDNTIRVFTVSV
ncbi:hypothetical protein BB560_000162 [Smittium megazygosporum]|uniref:Elongator complex protein 2 n=1 Tax=Smittium megazygosporum TaxID=133381 RepID=A0A2T9ZL90_9FUNG|nr:hypothetical protein BB560_000162 [Smittium megazygosporum]